MSRLLERVCFCGAAMFHEFDTDSLTCWLGHTHSGTSVHSGMRKFVQDTRFLLAQRKQELAYETSHYVIHGRPPSLAVVMSNLSGGTKMDYRIAAQEILALVEVGLLTKEEGRSIVLDMFPELKKRIADKAVADAAKL